MTETKDLYELGETPPLGHVPKQIFETLGPLLPRILYFIKIPKYLFNRKITFKFFFRNKLFLGNS